MRFLTLDLLRYGHLTDVRLRFPREAALHVVLGANEAGKSTALAAIGDALFGFPHRTPYDFLHDTAQLRIGFEVEARDGSTAAFIRRKGRRDTLLGADEQPVAEGALLRLLGGAGRDLFETGFGLNGRTLREGALSLLRSGGEAGESLLAGMGLPHLKRALERLDEQAKRIHGSRMHNQALGVAVEAWKEKHRAAEDAAIRPRDWTDAEAERLKIAQELDAATREAADLRTEAARLHRLRRVLPRLAQIAALRQEQADLAATPALPADAAATLRRLDAAMRDAAEALRREGAEAARLEDERAALPRDAAVLAEQDAIDAIAEARPTALAAERDLPGVAHKAAAQRAELAEAAAQLGLAIAPEALRDAVPGPALRARAQALIRRRTELETQLRSETAAERDALRRQDQARARLAAAAAPAGAAPLRRALRTAQAEGPLDRDLAGAERALVAAARAVTTALAELPLWRGDAAALAALPLPLEPACAEAERALVEARAALDAARAESAARAAEIARLGLECAHLARGETVPTRELIAATRARRDEAWHAFRAGAGAPESFEQLRDEADRLADARADDAGRVNDYAAKSARLVLLGAQHAGDDAPAAAQARLDVAEAGWRGLWAPAGIAPQAPAAMAEWRRRRAEVLRLAGIEAEARARRDALAERRDAARAALLALLPDAAPGLAALIERAEAECAAVEAAEQAHRKLVEAVERETRHAEEANAKRAEAAAALDSFGAEWREAARALSLPLEAGAAELEAALAAWTRIAEGARAWRVEEARVAEMRRAIDAFAAQLNETLARLGVESADPAPQAAAALVRRLADARHAERDAAALAKQARERALAAEEAARKLAAAEAGLATLRATARAEDVPALEDAIRRAERRQALETELAALLAELLRQGDGLDEAALRTEAEAADPDRAEARLAEIEAEQARRGARLTGLGAARQAVETRLAEMQAGRDAAAREQEARHHLAEAQSAAERYARLHLARSLLQAGIERIRQESQGPLLRAASGHFALLTEGRYARLSADEDEAGRALLRAVREDGVEVPVEALSEGARDQLYLALRAAAVEAHAERAEPLPFIADDLLASFDDARAAAALALLARLGGTTQVILFTHHAHVAELAARRPGVIVQELPAPARAAAVA